MWSHKQHNKVGNDLQIIHNQIITTCLVVVNAHPRKDKINRLAGKFILPLCNPIFKIRDHLDNQVLSELPRGQRATRIYFRNDSPNFTEPKLLIGVPLKMAQQFEQIQKGKYYTLASRKKTRLTEVELKTISVFFKHCGDRIAVIGIGISEHYHSDHKAITVIETVLPIIRELIQEIATLLQKNCKVAA